MKQPEREYCQEYIDAVDGASKTLSASEFYNSAVLAERERCAKIAEAQYTGIEGRWPRPVDICAEIAAAIRKGA